MRWLPLLALLVSQACCKHADPVVEGGTTDGGGTSDVGGADLPQPSETQAAMYRAMALRDHIPPCETIEAMSTAPAEDLVWIADNATMPPWVGPRAVHCLVVGHGPEATEALLRWVSDPETKGLGLVVLDDLDHLPDDLAVQVATRALEGPDPDAARERIRKDPREAIRAIAG